MTPEERKKLAALLAVYAKTTEVPGEDLEEVRLLRAEQARLEEEIAAEISTPDVARMLAWVDAAKYVDDEEK